MPTIKWLLKDSGLSNLRLLTSFSHINSPIQSVNVLDNPDVSKWFKKDELILTTGFIFLGNPELQSQYCPRPERIRMRCTCYQDSSLLSVNSRSHPGRSGKTRLPDHRVAFLLRLFLPFLRLFSISWISKRMLCRLHGKNLSKISWMMYSTVPLGMTCYRNSLTSWKCR